MKKLTLIFTLLFSTMMFSSSSYAGWTKIGENVKGTFYVDIERIRKVDGYVYWWILNDYLKPDKWGNLSAKIYHQGDCKLFRNKTLSVSAHKEPMGGGTSEKLTPPEKWNYPSPNSSGELNLKIVCAYAKHKL